MKITDGRASRLLKHLPEEFGKNIAEYSEDEREGRSDMDIIYDEIGYAIELLEEEITWYNTIQKKIEGGRL
jgi:hypothetical protein